MTKDVTQDPGLYLDNLIQRYGYPDKESDLRMFFKWAWKAGFHAGFESEGDRFSSRVVVPMLEAELKTARERSAKLLEALRFYSEAWHIKPIDNLDCGERAAKAIAEYEAKP